MKISLTSALVILALFAGLGWRDHRRVVEVKKEQLRILTEAAAAGIVLDSSEAGARITKLKRPDSGVAAKDVAKQLGTIFRANEAAGSKGLEATDEEEAYRLFGELERMNPGEIRAFIDELREDGKLSEDEVEMVYAMAITNLSADFPAEALAMFVESRLFDPSDAEEFLSSSLMRWARTDPEAASEWLEKLCADHPDVAADEANRGVIRGAATSDPVLAFKLIGSLKPENMRAALTDVMHAATNATERTAVLAAFRDYFANVGDDEERQSMKSDALDELAGSVVEEGFAASKQWLKDAHFSEEEINEFSSGIYTNTTWGENERDNAGPWLEWLGSAKLTEEVSDNITSIANEWAGNNYKEAGAWLQAAPEGPLKKLVVDAYAQAVAERDAEIGKQWVESWPAGSLRDEVLRLIEEKRSEVQPLNNPNRLNGDFILPSGEGDFVVPDLMDEEAE